MSHPRFLLWPQRFGARGSLMFSGKWNCFVLILLFRLPLRIDLPSGAVDPPKVSPFTHPTGRQHLSRRAQNLTWSPLVNHPACAHCPKWPQIP